MKSRDIGITFDESKIYLPFCRKSFDFSAVATDQLNSD